MAWYDAGGWGPNDPATRAMELLVDTSPFLTPYNFYIYVVEGEAVGGDAAVGFTAWALMMGSVTVFVPGAGSSIWSGITAAGLLPVAAALVVSAVAVDLVMRIHGTDEFGIDADRVERARTQSQSHYDWQPRGPRTAEDFQITY